MALTKGDCYHCSLPEEAHLGSNWTKRVLRPEAGMWSRRCPGYSLFEGAPEVPFERVLSELSDALSRPGSDLTAKRPPE